MPVTEFAILNLTGPSERLPYTYSVLIRARGILTSASGLPFHIYSSLKNERRLYLLGHWDSTAAHHAFLPSPENQALLGDLDGLLEVESMFHLDVDRNDLPLESGKVAFMRIRIAKEELDSEKMEGNGGWRIEESAEGDERVQFRDASIGDEWKWEESGAFEEDVVVDFEESLARRAGAE